MNDEVDSSASNDEIRSVLARFFPEMLLTVSLLILFFYVVGMIHYDSHVDNTRYSNRSLARPAAAISLVVTLYLAVRLRSIPLGIRLGGGLFLFSAGYFSTMILLIILNQVF